MQLNFVIGNKVKINECCMLVVFALSHFSIDMLFYVRTLIASDRMDRNLLRIDINIPHDMYEYFSDCS